MDLDTWYRRYGPMVLRRCRRLLRDEAKATDAMQDVFVQILRRHDSLTTESPSALLLKVAHNVCLNRLRSERRHPEDGDESLLVNIALAEEDATARPFARALLDRIFQREPVSTRTIATLHLLDGLTLEEVASEVGLSVSGVRKRLRTFKARVAELQEV
jgi:RNA polymerase sigma-70 factor (ECF subfamily)